MEAKTQSSESSKEPEQEVVVRGRRMEDELRLRELELQTSFQIKTLTESLNFLKQEFHSWRDSLNERLAEVRKETDSLKLRLSVVIALLIGQMTGVPSVLGRLLGV